MEITQLQSITESQAALLIRLLLAHLTADFLLQSKAWIISKKQKQWRSPPMYWHTLVIILLTYLFSGIWDKILIPVLIGMSHLAIDIWKSYRKDTVISFVSDQMLHLLALLLAWLFYTGLSVDVIAFTVIIFSSPQWMIILSAYIFVMWPVSFLIARITGPWQSEISPEMGLQEAGRWIGIWERFLTLTFVLIDQLAGIGFLITAKSILRFNDLKNATDRKNAEYILIGTMISITFALVTGLLVRWLI